MIPRCCFWACVIVALSHLAFPGSAVPMEGPIEVQSNCGYVKGCFMYPERCSSMETCEYLLTFRENGPYIDFEMSGQVSGPKSYVAVAFSSDKNMGEDSVIECVMLRNGTVAAYNSYNSVTNEGRKNNARLIRSTAGLNGTVGTYEDGILRCAFSRMKYVTGIDKIFNLNHKWYLFMAKGDADVFSGEITPHVLSPLPLRSKEEVDVRKIGSVSGGQCFYNLMVRIHGVLMVVAWIGCISTGILIARYYKFTWPTTTIAGEAVWFQLHRFLQLFGLVCIITAVILIFIDVGGWINSEIKNSLAHALCGIIAASFALIQPFLALCRCHPGTKHRPWFNWPHYIIGTVAHILALVAMYLAVDIPRTCLQRWVDYILVAFVIFHFIIEIILEIHACCYRDSKADIDELIMRNHGQFMREREIEEIHTPRTLSCLTTDSSCWRGSAKIRTAACSSNAFSLSTVWSCSELSSPSSSSSSSLKKSGCHFFCQPTLSTPAESFQNGASLRFLSLGEKKKFLSKFLCKCSFLVVNICRF